MNAEVARGTMDGWMFPIPELFASYNCHVCNKNYVYVSKFGL